MRNYYLLLFIFTFSSLGIGQEVLRLEDCIQKTRVASTLLQEMDLVNQLSETQKQMLGTNYLPQSTLTGKFSWQSDVTQVPVELPNFEIPVPNQDQYKIELGVIQNLWDGGRTRAAQAKIQADQKIAEQSLKVDQYQLEETITKLYLQALLAEQLEANYLLNIRELENNIQRLEAAVENGTAIEQDILRIQAQLAAINQKSVEADHLRQAAIYALAEWMDTDPQQILQNTLQLPDTSYPFDQQQQRPEEDLFLAQNAALLEQEKVINSQYLPIIQAFATAGYGQPGLNFLSNEFDLYAVVGVQLQIPISYLYNRKRDKEHLQLQIQRSRIQKKEEAFNRGNAVQRSQLETEVSKLRDWIQQDQEIVGLRQEIRDVSEVQWNNGVLSTTDYLNELNHLEQARQNLIIHEIQFAQKIQEIQYVLGIKPPVKPD